MFYEVVGFDLLCVNVCVWSCGRPALSGNFLTFYSFNVIYVLLLLFSVSSSV